jgi:hypothetical protein
VTDAVPDKALVVRMHGGPSISIPVAAAIAQNVI